MRRGLVGGLAMALLSSSALAGPALKVTLEPDAKGVTAKVLLSEAATRFVFEKTPTTSGRTPGMRRPT